MEDRGPILRLVILGLAGVVLVLMALWFGRRLAESTSQDGGAAAEESDASAGVPREG